MKSSLKLKSSLAALLTCASVNAETFSINSPDGTATLSVTAEQGKLFYELSDDGNVLIKKSALSVIKDAQYVVEKSQITSSDTTWKPVYGQFSPMRDNHSQLELTMKANNTPVTLLARLFDSGAGFRFVVKGKSELELSLNYELDSSVKLYYHIGESEPKGPATIASVKESVKPPMVIDQQEKGFMALLESDLYTATAFNSMVTYKAKGNASLTSVTAGKTVGDESPTPWRVILFGKTPGDLLESTASINLAAPCAIKDTSWIKTGKGLWDWRIHGYDNGDFKYDINTKSYLRMIDFAAANNIEFLTIDDHWYTTAKNGKMKPSPQVDLPKVVAYAKSKNVAIKLYYDNKKGKFGDDKLFKYYASLGVNGMKYGFMGSKVEFTRNSIRAAAENKLVLNFHDGPVPMTGVQRTMPNLISREYCHAQQDGRKAFSPRSFLKMAMINALTGPLDQANGNFGIKSINAGERKKGPSKKNSYVSTVVSECARALVIFSGIVTLPDAPEEYAKKSDLFEFLKKMPITWDETVVPNSKMAEYITTARRTGDTWFVGSVTDKKRDLDITCYFLKDGVAYEATLFEDTAESHGVKNPEVYQISKRPIKKGDVVTASMAYGGGHAMIIKPIK